MDTLDKVRAIMSAKKAGQGSIRDLCAKHGINHHTYYSARAKLRLKPRKVKTAMDQTSRRAPKFLDIPLVDAPTKVYIIACDLNDLKKVVSAL